MNSILPNAANTDEIDNESSVSSTPVQGTAEEEFGPLPLMRRSSSRGDADGGPYTATLGGMIRSAFPIPGVSFSARKDPTKASASPPNKNQQAAPSSLVAGLAVLTPKTPTQKQKTPTQKQKSPTQKQKSPVQTPKAVQKTPSVRSKSVSPRSNAETNLPPLSRSKTVDEMSIVAKGIQPSRIVRAQERRRRKASTTLASGITAHLYVFDAPCRGYLGLTLESSQKQPGSLVHTVKDHSPMYGLVLAGDKVVSVDNVDTSRMNSEALAKLLAFRRKDKKGTIPLGVARAAKKSLIRALPQFDSPSVAAMNSVAEEEDIPVFLNGLPDE